MHHVEESDEVSPRCTFHLDGKFSFSYESPFPWWITPHDCIRTAHIPAPSSFRTTLSNGKIVELRLDKSLKENAKSLGFELVDGLVFYVTIPY